MRLRSAVAVIAVMLVGAALVACTIYHREPLEDASVATALAVPDGAALTRDAARLQHPQLQPVAIDLAQPLSVDAVGIVSVLANPDLRALRLQQQVAAAQVFAAGLLPDPQFSIGRDRVLSAPDATYSGGFTAALTFDVLGPLATRSVELHAARAGEESLRLDVAWAEWATAGQARLLAVRLHYQVRAAALAREAADTTETALARALRAAGRHDLRADELEARRVAAADARARALAADRDAGTTRLELHRTLGFPPAARLAFAPPPALGDWRAPDAEGLFAAARRERLDLRALAAGFDRQQAVLERAVLGQYPRLVLTLNRARDTSRVNTFGPAVGLDLPLWNRNRGAIRVAAADRRRLRAEYAARLHQTRADIAALVAALERDERSRGALAAQAPDLERIAAAYAGAAARGDVTAPVAEAARLAATDRTLALLAAEQACAEERIGLVLAVGRPLTDSELPP